MPRDVSESEKYFLQMKSLSSADASQRFLIPL